MEVSNLILAGIAAAAAVAGVWYQRHTRRERQLEEITDLLADLRNHAEGWADERATRGLRRRD